MNSNTTPSAISAPSTDAPTITASRKGFAAVTYKERTFEVEAYNGEWFVVETTGDTRSEWATGNYDTRRDAVEAIQRHADQNQTAEDATEVPVYVLRERLTDAKRALGYAMRTNSPDAQRLFIEAGNADRELEKALQAQETARTGRVDNAPEVAEIAAPLMAIGLTVLTMNESDTEPHPIQAAQVETTLTTSQGVKIKARGTVAPTHYRVTYNDNTSDVFQSEREAMNARAAFDEGATIEETTDAVTGTYVDNELPLPEDAPQWILKRDGQELARFSSELDMIREMHKRPYSMFWACKYEGYTMEGPEGEIKP